MLHEVPNLYLTDSFISSAKCPSDKDQIIYWDHPKGLDGKLRNGSTSGLGIRITRNGAKSFVHAFHFNGERKRAVIGKPPTMSVGNARLSTQQRTTQIEAGVNPDADKVDYRKKHALTFKELADMYFEQHLQDTTQHYRDYYCRVIAPWHLKPQTSKLGRNRRTAFNAFGHEYGSAAATSITPQQVKKYLSGIKSDQVSNSVFRYLKALYNWAIRMQIIEMLNPCMPLKERKIIRKRRDYTPDDIATLAGYIFNPPIEALTDLLENTPQERQRAALKRNAMHKQNMQMQELCHFLGILFLTMARPNELRQAKFEHFDTEQLIWHKHNTKGQKLSKATYEYASRSVPVHPKIIEIVTKQKERWPEAEHVFPCHTDITQPRNNFKRALTRFKTLPGVPAHFQMYDVKRIAISLMLTGQGIRREDLSHYVDHKGNLETTMIYDLGFVDPMRPVTNKLGELLGV